MSKTNQPDLDELHNRFLPLLDHPTTGAKLRGDKLAAYVFEAMAGGAELRACKKFIYCGIEYNPGDPFQFERLDHDRVIAGGAYVLPLDDFEANQRHARALELDEKVIRPGFDRLAPMRAEIAQAEARAAELRAQAAQLESELRAALLEALGGPVTA